MKLNKGYTLIELLAVVSILTIISGVMAGILYSTLRGTSKVRITTEVAQNGDYALTIIKGIIADSRDITQVDDADISDCTNTPRSPTNPPTSTCQEGDHCSITLRRIDGGSSKISCQSVDADPGPGVNNVFTIASNGASLINNNTVKVDSCVFSCSQLVDDPYSVPVVNISFTVSDLQTGLFETRSSSDFDLSTSLRTYSP
jgi:prepilin-type N-terminal cleavage/methylation domain-containing protein